MKSSFWLNYTEGLYPQNFIPGANLEFSPISAQNSLLLLAFHILPCLANNNACENDTRLTLLRIFMQGARALSMLFVPNERVKYDASANGSSAWCISESLYFAWKSSYKSWSDDVLISKPFRHNVWLYFFFFLLTLFLFSVLFGFLCFGLLQTILSTSVYTLVYISILEKFETFAFVKYL